MKASYSSSVLLSAVIKLSDITEEAYRDILDYIEKKIAEPVKQPKVEDVSSVQTVDISVVEDYPEETVTDLQRESSGRRSQISEDLEKLCIEYMSDPNRKEHYILMEMTAEQFILKHPEYEGLTAKGAGKCLSMVLPKYSSVLPMPVRTTLRVDEVNSVQYRQVKLYYIPRRRKLISDVILGIMHDKMITLKELSVMTGYSVDIIKMWMNNELPMSDTAEERFRSLFGEHILDGVEYCTK